MKQLYELYAYSYNTRQYTHPVAVVTMDTALEASIKELLLVEDATEVNTIATFSDFSIHGNYDINLEYIDSYGDTCYDTYSLKPIDMRYIL